jgi:hypothetical protein
MVRHARQQIVGLIDSAIEGPKSSHATDVVSLEAGAMPRQLLGRGWGSPRFDCGRLPPVNDEEEIGSAREVQGRKTDTVVDLDDPVGKGVLT